MEQNKETPIASEVLQNIDIRAGDRQGEILIYIQDSNLKRTRIPIMLGSESSWQNQTVKQWVLDRAAALQSEINKQSPSGVTPVSDSSLLAEINAALKAKGPGEIIQIDPPAETVLVCDGCGSTVSDEDVARIRDVDPRYRACCPERKMRPVTKADLVAKATRFYQLKYAADKIGAWLSAALDDPKVTKAMKDDIEIWFKAVEENL